MIFGNPLVQSKGGVQLPKRKDLQKILIIGSGPIVIGQACEFDYSGSQACKALKEEGYKIVLVNSNPATIMTDPEMADATYIEPLTVEVVKKVIEREKPDAVLPNLGGQTALNLVFFLEQEGFLVSHGVEVLGTAPSAIALAEDRGFFRQAMHEINVKVPESNIANTVKEAERIASEIGYPSILRPAYTLGGRGGGAGPWQQGGTAGVRLSMLPSALDLKPCSQCRPSPPPSNAFRAVSLPTQSPLSPFHYRSTKMPPGSVTCTPVPA